MSYLWPEVSRDRVVQPMEARFAVPVFSLPMPWTEPLRLRRQPSIRFPQFPPESPLRANRAEGTVILEFVVDSTGRVQAHTIEEQWPADRPRLTGDLAAHYEAFLDAARRGVARARFHPALIGGCPVQQLAQMPFVFRYAY